MHCNSEHPNFDALLKVEQAAERLSCSKPQVYLLIRRGILPAVRIEKMVRVRNSDLESFINNHLTPAKESLNSSCWTVKHTDSNDPEEGEK